MEQMSINPYSTVTFTCTSFASQQLSTVILCSTSSVNHVSLGGLNAVYHYRAVFLVLDEGWNVAGTRSGHAVAAGSAAAVAASAQVGGRDLLGRNQIIISTRKMMVEVRYCKHYILFSDQWKYIFNLVINGNTSLIFLLNKAIIEINIYYDQNY